MRAPGARWKGWLREVLKGDKSAASRAAWFGTVVVLCCVALGCDKTGRYISDARSNDPARQIPAAHWLAENPTPDALDALRFGMQSTSLDVRVASALAIGATRNARAMGEASRILRADALHEDRKIAETALAGMRGIGGAALPDLVAVAILTTDRYVQMLVRASIAEALVTASDSDRLAAAAAMVAGVEDTDPDLYRAAYAILVTFAQMACPELLDMGLSHGNRRIQLTTMMGMTDAGCLDAAPAIARFLSNAGAGLRLEAARSLGVIGGPPALPELDRLAATDPVLDVRRAAREAAAAIRAAPPLAAEDGE